MPGSRQFDFPHFLVIGWAKSGTTSLYEHLVKQPQILPPLAKEPRFFAHQCPPVVHCEEKWLQEPAYIRELLGAANASEDTWRHAAFEASPNYAHAGAQVAPRIRAALPWVRVVALLREPVSRVISHLVHLAEEQAAVGVSSPTTTACVTADGDIFPCLASRLQRRNYSAALTEWLRAFPARQLFVARFEQLTGDGQAGVLRDLHRFLGLDPPVAGLPHANSRKQRKPEGWALRREQYQQLVDVARRDTQEVVELVTRAGLADGSVWLSEWERVWAANLERCDAAGQCRIQLT